MLKRRLRLPLGAGLLRPYAASARTSPFSRAAAVASIHDDQFPDQTQQQQQEQLYQQQQQELYQQQLQEQEKYQQQQQIQEEQQRGQQIWEQNQQQQQQEAQQQQSFFRSLPTGLKAPKLKSGDAFNRAGVPGLYSPYGFAAAWSYQAWCIDMLNERTAGMFGNAS